MKLRYPVPLLKRRRSKNAVERILDLIGYGYLTPNVTHLFHPNNADLSSGNRHYLNVAGIWTATGTTMTGTMDAVGTVTGGTFSITVPATCVEQFHVAWWNAGVRTVLFSIGFNRALTAAERTALSGVGFFGSLTAGTAVTAAQCSAIYPMDYQSLVALYDMVQGANAQRVYNKAYVGPRTNLLVDSEDFNNGWLTTTGITKTTTTLVFGSGAVAKALAPLELGWLAAYTAGIKGNYTITVQAKVTAGTDTFRLSIRNNGGTTYHSEDFTATTDWQTFSFTYNVQETISQYVTPLITQASDLADHGPISFRYMRFNSSAADLGAEETPTWDASLGQQLSVEASYDPAFAAAGLTCGGTKATKILGYAGHAGLSANTIYALFKSTATPDVANDAQLVVGSCGIFASLSAPWPGRNESTKKYAYGAKVVNDSNWHVLAVTFGSSVTNIYLDGVLMDTYAGSGNFVMAGNSLCGVFTSGFPGTVGAIAIFNAVHAAAEIARHTITLNESFCKQRGGAMFTYTNFAAIDGDSISERNTGVDYASKAVWLACNSQTPFLFHRNFALSAGTIATRTTAAPAGLDLYANTGSGKNVCVLWAGTNDIQGAANAATVYARWQAYCAARFAAGWDKVVLVNILPRNAVGFNAIRNSANALLTADHSFCSAVADVASDATIGVDGAELVAELFADGIHPTAAGQALCEPYITAAIAAALA